MNTTTPSADPPAEILIVEDSPTQAQQLQHILEQQGYRVTQSANGKLALEAAQRRKPMVIISDVVMPEMDGYELCRRVKADASLGDIPVILVTTLSDPSDVIRGLECGADNFVLKPFDPHYLLGRVQFVLLNREVLHSERVTMGVEIFFNGQRHFITADRLQILNLLLSTYDAAIQRTKELIRSQEKLGESNRSLGETNLRLKQVIAERKKVEQALRTSEENLAVTLQSIGDAVLATDVAGRVTRLNAVAEALTGWTAAEAAGRPVGEIFNIINLETRQPAFIPVADTLAKGAVHALANQTVLIARDGTERAIADSCAPIRSREGAVIGAVLVFRDVTEQKRASAQIASNMKALAEFKAALDEHAIVAITDSCGKITYANDKFCEISKYAREELLGQDHRIIKSSHHPKAFFRDLWETITSGRTWKGEIKSRAKDGSLFWLNTTIVPFLGDDGKPVQFIAIRDDITKHKQAEDDLRASEERLQELNKNLEGQVIKRTGELNTANATLRASEERFRIAAETANDVVYEWDLEQSVHWPGKIDEMLGYRPGEFPRTLDGWMASVHPEDLKHVMAAMKACVEGYELYNEEYRVRRKDGTYRWWSNRGAVARTPDKKPVRWIGSVTDITERRLADEALLREQGFFKDLANTIPDHIYFKDRQSRFVRVNEANARLFGLHSPNEMIGKTDFDFFSQEHAQKAYADEQRIMETGEPMIGVEEKETWPDGHITWVSTTKMPLRDELGCITGIVGISRDITEKKQFEEQALRAQRLDNIGLLAGGIAHDLNNALAPIIMAGPLLHQYLSDPGAQRMLGIVEQSSMRGAALVRQMVSFARGSGTEMQLLQISRVLREVIDLAKSTFPRSIRIESHLPNDLWPVMSDPTRIHQVFVNLCVNARDAMPDGGELTLSAANRTLDAGAEKISPEARPGEFLAVEVCDTGTGIAPEVMEKIWEPFFTTKALGKGTGLGLSTVRNIVRQHNGFVTVQTSYTLKSPHGSTFTVYLPAAKGEKKREPSAHPFESQSGNGELILVVDDEKPVCELTSKILIRFGYKVVKASDGVEAIAAFVPRSAEVRLLITDLEMPIVNGLALATALRRLKPELPIVAMSGGNSQNDEMHKQFTTTFLAKPFEGETLLSIVRRALDAPSGGDSPRT